MAIREDKGNVFDSDMITLYCKSSLNLADFLVVTFNSLFLTFNTSKG